MNAFPDTSFLCAIYRKQDNSQQAQEFYATLSEPIAVSRLLLWEFRQAARFQAFRHSKDRSQGYSLREAERMIDKINEHVNVGVLRLVEVDSFAVLARGELLSKTRTPVHGHRGFDILHVAAALESGCTDFLTFDGNQTALARSQGLAVPLAN